MYQFARALLVEGNSVVADRVAAHLRRLGFELAASLPTRAAAVRHCRHDTPDLIVMGEVPNALFSPEVALEMIREREDVAAVYLTDAGEQTGSSVPRTAPWPELARGIAHAFGAGAPERDFSPPQDFILHDRILLRHQERMVRVPLEEVRYFHAERSYTMLRTATEEFVVPVPIQVVEHRVAHLGFLRTHRAYLVNPAYISAVRPEQLEVHGARVPIGRGYRRRVGRQVRALVG